MPVTSTRRATTCSLVAAGLLLVAPGPARAGTPGTGSPHASSPGHFSYVDPLLGPVRCNEVHHPGRIPSGLLTQTPALPQTTAGYDTVSCRLAAPDGVRAGQGGLQPWITDFPGGPAGLGVIRMSVDADGSHYHGVASYPGD